MATETTELLYTIEGPLAYVTFNRPEARNAMTWGMYDRLYEVCDEIEANPDVRVAIFQGAGDRAFVAGTDISQFQSFSEERHALEYEERIERILSRIESLARPTIALIRGYAVGGGLAIAASCDLRYCTPNSKFGAPVARTLGNCMAIGNFARLTDLIGPMRTKELLFTATFADAQQGLNLGLITEIVEPDQIEARVNEVASLIAGNAPLTVRATKEAVRRLANHRRPGGGEDIILSCYMSEDFKEGMSAFLEKRDPVWKGR